MGLGVKISKYSSPRFLILKINSNLAMTNNNQSSKNDYTAFFDEIQVYFYEI